MSLFVIKRRRGGPLGGTRPWHGFLREKCLGRGLLGWPYTTHVNCEIANGDRGWAILVQGAKRGFSHSCRSQNPSIAKDLTRGVEGRGAGENEGSSLNI